MLVFIWADRALPHHLGSKPGSSPFLLCDSGTVSVPLCACFLSNIIRTQAAYLKNSRENEVSSYLWSPENRAQSPASMLCVCCHQSSDYCVLATYEALHPELSMATEHSRETSISLTSKLYQERKGAAGRKEQWASGRLQIRGCSVVCTPNRRHWRSALA